MSDTKTRQLKLKQRLEAAFNNKATLEQLVLTCEDVCARWRQHSRSGGQLSLLEFAERALKAERMANREMPDGAAYYADIP